MNKRIKLRNQRKLEYKKIFSKEERIFRKKYPRLYVTAMAYNISLGTINKNKRKLRKVKIVEPHVFEMMYQTLIVAKGKKHNFQIGGRGAYYKMLFERANILI